MRIRIMGSLQRFSEALFIPVLIIPVIGILLVFGNLLTNTQLLEVVPLLDHSILTGFGTILSDSLLSILNYLGLIFAVGLAIGWADKKEAQAGLTALIAYVVFIYAMNGFMELNVLLATTDSLQETGQTMLFGVQVFDTGVFSGIVLGIVTGLIHNKFADIEFKNAFQIYGGSRFVVLILIPLVVLLGILFSSIWPVIQSGISRLGALIQQSGNIGIFIYGALERLLIPVGLHHLVSTPLLYTELGGVAEVGSEMFSGARNIYFGELTHSDGGLLAPSVIWDARGISKMFGLVGASLAMYHTAKPENKQRVRVVLVPAVFTSFMAGVTEPIEFTFILLAPALFVVHSILSGLSMVVLNVLDVRAIGPSGFIEFVLYNVPLGIERTRWPMFVFVGILFFVIYYVVFRFLIQQFNFKTIGREDVGQETKLYSKEDFLEREGDTLAKTIVTALGGPGNIQTLTNCYSRLRLTVLDPNKVDEHALKNKTGASGVMIKNQNVQVVYGLQVENIRKAIDHFLDTAADKTT